MILSQLSFGPSELGQRSARDALRHELHVLNNTIGDEWLVTSRNEVAFVADADVWVDIESFRQQIASCTEYGHAEDEPCDQYLKQLTAAATLY